MQRELIFLGADADPWTAPARVLVLVGAAAERDEVLADVDGRLGTGVARSVARRSPSDVAGAITVVDADHDTWHQVAYLVMADGVRGARAGGAALANAVSDDAVLVLADGLADDEVAALLEGWRLAGYRYSLASTASGPKGSLSLARDAADFAAAQALTDAAVVARDLANTPSNIKSPEWLAERIRTDAQAAGLRVRVLGADELRARGFGGLLAVAEGSARDPRLVTVTSPGRTREAPRVVLIGKGVTYDSGGLSIKPADSMALMKTDMAGAAAVAGAMLAYAADPGANADAEVVALLPLAENMPSGSAYRPGDVIRHYGGITTEVSNTDAEGRLLLADMLAYAHDDLRPDAVVDIATLTGAATASLSRHFAALYSDDEALAAQLAAAGEESGDRLWRMPLVPGYRRHLESPIADTAQAATAPGVHAGSILAALYLQRFVGDLTWAHIDMAGPGRADKPRGEHPVGATGYGARLLATWLRRADLTVFSPPATGARKPPAGRRRPG